MHYWAAHGAVHMVQVNIDATVFSAVQSDHSSPRLQEVFVLCGGQLKRLQQHSHPAAMLCWWQLSASAASLTELLVQLVFYRTCRRVVFLERRTLCCEDTFCIQYMRVAPR